MIDPPLTPRARHQRRPAQRGRGGLFDAREATRTTRRSGQRVVRQAAASGCRSVRDRQLPERSRSSAAEPAACGGVAQQRRVDEPVDRGQRRPPGRAQPGVDGSRHAPVIDPEQAVIGGRRAACQRNLSTVFSDLLLLVEAERRAACDSCRYTARRRPAARNAVRPVMPRASARSTEQAWSDAALVGRREIGVRALHGRPARHSASAAVIADGGRQRREEAGFGLFDGGRAQQFGQFRITGQPRSGQRLEQAVCVDDERLTAGRRGADAQKKM